MSRKPQKRGALSGSVFRFETTPGRANPNVYPVAELLASNNAISVPQSSSLSTRPTYAAQLQSNQAQPAPSSPQQWKMSGKQPSAGGKALPKGGSTLHGRPALDVTEPAPARPPPKPKSTGPPPNENWEQDGEMNAHLAEKFRRDAFKSPDSEERAAKQYMLPPHPLLAK